jgi:hypothetical protein
MIVGVSNIKFEKLSVTGSQVMHLAPTSVASQLRQSPPPQTETRSEPAEFRWGELVNVL